MKKAALAFVFGILIQLSIFGQTPQDDRAKTMTDKYVVLVESNITLEASEKEVLTELKLTHIKALTKVHMAFKDAPDVKEKKQETSKVFVTALREKLGAKRANAILKAGQPQK